MPKRSNEFQKAITALHKSFAGEQASVRESVELPEKTTGVLREVDILVEQQVAGYPVRIAIECRDRSDKDDVTWVDEIIGKYRDLEVSEVILVSRSGFTSSAQAKADALGITTCTARELSEKDWPAEFQRLGAATVARTDEFLGVMIDIEPEVNSSDLVPTATVRVAGSLTTLERYIAGCFHHHVKPMVSQHIAGHAHEIYPMLADLAKEAIFDVPVTFDGNCTLETPTGAHLMKSGLFRVRVSHTYSRLVQRHFEFRGAIVSTGELDTGNGVMRTINIVQPLSSNKNHNSKDPA